MWKFLPKVVKIQYCETLAKEEEIWEVSLMKVASVVVIAVFIT